MAMKKGIFWALVPGLMLGLNGIAAAQETTPAAAPEAAPAPQEEPTPEAQASSGFFSGWFPNFDMSFAGFLRTESTVSSSSTDNPANQLTNEFNGRPQHRQAY